ncbi:hypothetical protein F5X68DRAFT_127656 [Plectosphaerella plurivora]|uniref:NmrA-like domain-containing protein n=1 Tax=Plectosphaerella plurivora TaxID=936078 RepID=A0A9P8VLA5_9PEZI|nr:hypothetical protein F5X68DRAFT_127656 [Plectosphaerella plurivora]
MSVIAVAGGTGKLGRAIVEALNATGKFTVFILGREVCQCFPSTESFTCHLIRMCRSELGAKILAVNYDDVPSITATLEKSNIDTVISAVTSVSTFDPELALIAASDKSSVTKRFIPSIWGVPYSEEIAALFPPAENKIKATNALEATSLDWTSVYNGYFLDYFGIPKVKSYMDPISLAVDVANDFAAIPGSGNVPITFTHTFDIAKYVAAYVQKATWEKEVYIIGDKVTWNEFVALAEDARGKKFTVVYDPLEKLAKGEITELPSHTHLYPFFPKPMLQGLFAAFGTFIENGVFDFKVAHTLNQEFPEIKARTVKEVLDAAWKQ